MPRAALLVMIGIVVGAAGAVFFDPPRPSAPPAELRDAAPPMVSTSAPTRHAEQDASVVDALAIHPQGTAERAALYAAAARGDARGVETLLIGVRALSDRDARTFALDVLLARYAEIDPPEAVAAAKELDVPAASLVPLYRAWLKSSQPAALASLGALDERKKTEVATGVLALAGDDEALFARLIAILPAQSRALQGNALAQLARTSPAEAFERARKVADSIERKQAVLRVLATWAQSDPRAVVNALAGLDAETRRDMERSGVWQQIAMAAPELALERTDTLPADLRPSVQSTAIQALAQRDPKTALARLADMPNGVINREGMLPLVARAYASRDAEGALAWARTLQPPVPGAMAAVVSGIADKDSARAFELASEIASPIEQLQALQSVVSMAVLRNPASIGPVLERVLAMPNGAQRQALVQSAVSSLANSDPAKAAEWLIANPGQSSDVVSQVASAYARTDPARAVSYSARLSGDPRVAWVRGAAAAYAQVDPRGALDWAEQLHGAAEYDDAAFAVLQSGTLQDPAAAARLVDSISRDDYRRNGTLSLAMRWTNTDPAAAANWAANLRDPAIRATAMQMVGSTWAQQNAPAAKEWILSQAPGPARDSALQSLISVSARFGPPDAALLADISTDQGRVAAVQQAAMMMAQRYADGARAFVESNVASPQDRERVLSVVSQVSATRRFGTPSPIVGAMYPAGIAQPVGIAQREVAGARIASGPAASFSSAQGTVPLPAGSPNASSAERR